MMIAVGTLFYNPRIVTLLVKYLDNWSLALPPTFPAKPGIVWAGEGSSEGLDRDPMRSTTCNVLRLDPTALGSCQLQQRQLKCQVVSSLGVQGLQIWKSILKSLAFFICHAFYGHQSARIELMITKNWIPSKYMDATMWGKLYKTRNEDALVFPLES